ncbi:chorismate-pyruvate lyase [Novosphingobium chloroacetimidivorans]|uniref:Chorismate-pyruvate lyase n=1 Tax=Novosphingobium chloroacetimidivorans TaxID=1428314 RepID=A0A7W7NY68_9SPHN|nr:hypothetical protein [Novosphingobium chloroacetimidivorans]MBB4859925.1 chorismate-pyruvate lyase [Novosphingobium chloroacetimidivorans]
MLMTATVGVATALAANPSTVPLATFEAVLARHDSATRALEEWCGRRRIATPAIIRAQSLGTSTGRASAQVRKRLGVDARDAVAIRHVRLSCGDKALSIAWNWYVPARLTPEMRDALRTTDTPFGKVVAALAFRRVPLPTVPGRADTCPAGTISTHRARLLLPDGKPLAYVIECYTAANLAAN